MKLTDNAQLGMIVDSAPIGICILNAETLVAEMLNDKFLEIAGKPREAILGKWYWEAFAEAKEYFERALAEVVISGEPYYADEVKLMLVRHGKQEWIYVTFVYAPVKNTDGQVTKVAVWVLEHTSQVHERQKVTAEREAAERERDRLYNFFRQAPAGICVMAGPDFVYELVNVNYQALLPGRELLGRPMFEAVPELIGTPLEQVLKEVYATGKPKEFSELLVPFNEYEGGPTVDRYFTFSYVPRFDAQDMVDGIFVFAYEVTHILQSKFAAEQAVNNLQQIIDILPASVVVIRGDDLIVEMINNSNLNYWKKSKEEVLGRPFLEILPDLADQPFAGQLREVMRTGEVLDVKESPVLFTMADGSIRETFVDYTYQPLSDIKGNITGVLVMSFEITDRVHSKRMLEKYAEELAISEARFKFVIQEAPVAIGVLAGRELIVESANAKILEVWGKTKEIVGMKLEKALPELQGQQFLGILDEVFTSGIAFHAEEIKAMLEHDGELKEFFFNVVYQPVANASGATADILVVAVDVTAQVQARRKVEHAEVMLRHALEAGNVGTWNIHTETRKMIASPRLKELFGYDQEDEMELAHAIAQIDEEHREAVAHAVDDAIQNGGNYDISYKVIGYRDKKVRWVRGLGNLAVDESGKFTTFTGVIMDITDIKEDEIRKNDFIGMVSHEMKTPLTSLNAYLQLMQRKAGKGEVIAGQSFEQPLKQVRQLTALINGFLNVSRLDAGKIHIEKSRFDIAEMIAEVYTEHIDLYSTHQITSDLKAGIYVEADRAKLSQVVNNLMSNAVKYSPVGSKIMISCAPVGDLVRVAVSDRGIGIDQADLEKLFERFYRVENNTNISGFGIGLYLSAEIIDRHGGKIWAESERGKGSTFYFELPIAEHDGG
ncbi:PAS domain S-box-containing protein [Pedobacter sp. AK017]|uniref:PAS domain-containing protein n=1 Tax=Pedobacter sp. AK017 TaxID=2723073 RepID=UPI001618B7D7|nr:PAS domain-containing protein [Pedobacter sp. AK017]MBB5438903.1 PAS domain S-box-containing protein [Pedobacter sp. AK017]